MANDKILDAARRAGFRDNDPLMPLIVALQDSYDSFNVQRCELTELYKKAHESITRAMEQRIAFGDAEVARLKERAKTLQLSLAKDIGETIARASEEALTKHIRVVELRTICGLVGIGIFVIASVYSLSYYNGYARGHDDAQNSADVQITKLQETASAAAKLFLDRPQELAVWGPIIRLNRLYQSSRLQDCYTTEIFEFDNRPDQPGCWLPLRIPVPEIRPQTMTIPLPPPEGPPADDDQ